MLSQGISILGYVLLWFLMVPGKPWMFMFALPFFSFGIGGLFTLMMSMTADVCDLDELATGKRREGIFGAIYWWMVKLGFAVAGLLSGAIMSFVAFTPGAAVQPDGAVDGLRLFYSGVPIFGTLLAMWIMRDYDLDEKRAIEVHAELERRKRRGARVVVPGLGRPALAGGARPAAAGRGALAAGRQDDRRDPGAVRRAVPARPVRPVLQRLRRGAARGRPAAGVAGQPAHRPRSRRTRAGCAPSPAPRGTK